MHLSDDRAVIRPCLSLESVPMSIVEAKRVSKQRPVAAPAASTFVVEAESVHIPAGIADLKSFREWVHSDAFPETGRICYLNGEVWVDMSKEQFLTHNQLKHEIGYVLTGLVRALRLGRFVPDGMLLTNEAADLTVQPDGCYVSREALRDGRVKLQEGKDGGFVELLGTPDMVLEVVSTGSVEKDTVTLRELYWRANIAEYWLVDARGAVISIEILRHTAKGYAPARKQRGWVRSPVFRKSFRLLSRSDALGDPEFELAVR